MTAAHVQRLKLEIQCDTIEQSMPNTPLAEKLTMTANRLPELDVHLIIW